MIENCHVRSLKIQSNRMKYCIYTMVAADLSLRFYINHATPTIQKDSAMQTTLAGRKNRGLRLPIIIRFRLTKLHAIALYGC